MLRLGEAADRLGLSRRDLQDFLSTQPSDENGVAFYQVVDGERMFDGNDLSRIRKAIGTKKNSRFYSHT